jgi:Glycosyl transferases group 1
MPIALPNRFFSSPVDMLDGGGSDALLLSMRQVADLVGYCALYEFEDIVAELTGADVARPTSMQNLQLSRRIYRATRYLTRSAQIAESVRLTAAPLVVKKDYELFLAVFNHPYELFALTTIDGWRERSKFAVCYLCEAWDAELPVYLVELLREFDHVFVGVDGALDAVARIAGRPCSYLPMGVDALRFSPYPNAPGRFIDFCGIGRRSAVTHAALLDWAAENSALYYYDTVQAKANQGSASMTTFRVNSPREHRLLLSNLLKRSRYFMANRAWADRPALTGGKDEIAARFYEGAAAGTVMLGDPPKSEQFRIQFGWQDAVIPVPFHSRDVTETLNELEANPERVNRIRRDGVANSLLQHDWVYRFRKIREALGLPPTTRQLAREARLRELADEVRAAPTEMYYATK